MLFKATPMLEVQTVAFRSHPYAGSTNSCFLNQLLHWRYNLLLSKATPTLLVQTVSFQINLCTRGTNSCFLNQPYAGGTNKCFLKLSLLWRYIQCTKSCFLNQPLCWRYKRLPSEGIPTLEVQRVAF